MLGSNPSDRFSGGSGQQGGGGAALHSGKASTLAEKSDNSRGFGGIAVPRLAAGFPSGGSVRGRPARHRDTPAVSQTPTRQPDDASETWLTTLATRPDCSDVGWLILKQRLLFGLALAAAAPAQALGATTRTLLLAQFKTLEASGNVRLDLGGGRPSRNARKKWFVGFQSSQFSRVFREGHGRLYGEGSDRSITSGRTLSFSRCRWCPTRHPRSVRGDLAVGAVDLAQALELRARRAPHACGGTLLG